MTSSDSVAVYAEHFGRPLGQVVSDLESYAKLLAKWQTVQNLVSRETLAEIWTRHFADSLQILTEITDHDHSILDLGSGGGFPALPLAIASKGKDRRYTLVEPTARKVSFLRTVARELSLDVLVIGQRSEQIDSRETALPDVITSRALAALPLLCSWMAPFFGERTRAILHKGREYSEELNETRASWDFDVVVRPSDIDPSGVILTLTNLRSRSVR